MNLPERNETAEELTTLYRRRFARTSKYRDEVWKVLTRDFFPRWVRPSDRLLDLGCGYGEFVNNIVAQEKFAMDLNPDVPAQLASGVELFRQDSSAEWPLPDETLDVVFTSNFFEHLPNKESLRRTLSQVHRCLRSGGRLIALGPNIKFLPGKYWDFFDHHLALTELSLSEALEAEGFQTEYVVSRFLPYTLINTPRFPLAFLRLYLKARWIWPLIGQQFLVIAVKRAQK